MQPQNLVKRLNGQENPIIKTNDLDRQPILLDKELKCSRQVRQDKVPCKG